MFRSKFWGSSALGWKCDRTLCARTVEWLTLTCSLLEVQVGFLGENPRWSSPSLNVSSCRCSTSKMACSPFPAYARTVKGSRGGAKICENGEISDFFAFPPGLLKDTAKLHACSLAVVRCLADTNGVSKRIKLKDELMQP